MPRRAVTLREIARRTGVHASTVSRALNARTRHLVARDVAARIAATARELGYRPNAVAAALRTRHTMMVGCLVDDIAQPTTAARLAGVEETLRAAGYATIVGATGGDGARTEAALAEFDGRGVDGTILLTAAAPAAPPRFPLVGLADIVEAGGGAIGLAVAHLAGLGHRTIGCLTGPAGHAAAARRLAAFRAAMTRAGLFAGAVETAGDMTVDAGRGAADALLARRPDLTAIVADDDRLALGALAALAARGRRCPGDVSVTGFGDLPPAARATPPLTTVRFDPRDAGRCVAALLLARLADAPAPADLVARLCLRGSTAPPNPADESREPSGQSR
jgi:LacI family transcriptional regulator